MFLTSIVKRCIVFVNWKKKTPREEFEPKRNLSCDSAEYIFLVVTGIPSRRYLRDIYKSTSQNANCILSQYFSRSCRIREDLPKTNVKEQFYCLLHPMSKTLVK